MTTIREMVSEVLDNLERFPKGWGTTVKDYFKAKGKDHLEVKQTKVWMLTIRKAYEGVMPDTVICRKLATAKAKMEADISETLANADGEFDAERVALGQCVPMTLSNGQRAEGLVVDITDTQVTLDFNHQLAGETVRYQGKVLQVRDATEQELHPHQGCGSCGGSCGEGGCSGCSGCH